MASAQLLGGKYRIERQIVRGDRTGRLPSLYEVSDAGLFLFARTWARSSNSADLRALWNHEVRSLLRLGGYPRSSDYFVRLRDLGTEDKRFYVILDAGDRQLLAPMLSARGSRAWLRDVSTPTRRRRIWDGLRRVAAAISMLHEEGTIHRAISPASVFSDDRGDCDFRLSGFEWSLRITTPTPVTRGSTHAASTTTRLRAPELEKADARYSFATDWFDFGVLCTEIFGFEPTGRGAKTVERLREVVLNLTYLGPPERALILGLLETNPEQRFAHSATILQGLSEAHASVREPYRRDWQAALCRVPVGVRFALVGSDSGHYARWKWQYPDRRRRQAGRLHPKGFNGGSADPHPSNAVSTLRRQWSSSPVPRPALGAIRCPNVGCRVL